MTEHVVFRIAKRDDLPEIVRMLANDKLGSQRERYTLPLPESYLVAFDAMDRDSNNELIVAEAGAVVIGVIQLTFTPYLSYGGKLIAWAIERAKQRNCRMVQVTSDKRRPEAIRFYEKLGFVPTHEGLKLHLQPPLSLDTAGEHSSRQPSHVISTVAVGLCKKQA